MCHKLKKQTRTTTAIAKKYIRKSSETKNQIRLVSVEEKTQIIQPLNSLGFSRFLLNLKEFCLAYKRAANW